MGPLNVRPHVATLGVSVEAVKEQLLLLGHTIPDDVIKAFLDDGLSGRPLTVPFMHVAAITADQTLWLCLDGQC